MKKQNILDLIASDFLKKLELEKNNKEEIIKNKDEETNLCHHINLFLTGNNQIYNLDFNYNIKSSNEIEQAKSLYLLHQCICESINLISATPSFFKHYEKTYNTSAAFDEICFRVLLGNILEFKEELKQINKENAISIIDSLKELYDLLLNTKYKPYK